MRQNRTNYVQDLLANYRTVADEILREKDVNVGGSVRADMREYDRFQYQIPQGLIFRVIHPGGTESAFLVLPYNISQGGIGFIHGGYVYPASRCSIDLQMPDGTTSNVAGTVARCNLIRGRVHDIGMKFDSPVKHGWYDGDVSAEPKGEAPPDLPAFEGNVLYFTESKAERDLMRCLISRLKVNVETSAKVMDAMRAVNEQKFDLVLVSVWDAKECSGLEFVKGLVAGGYAGPIVGLLGESDATAEAAALQAGCGEVISQAYKDDALIHLLERYLAGGAAAGMEPLYSSRWSDQQLRPLIMHYLQTLEKHIQSIQQMVAANEASSAKLICRDIRVTADAYGFEVIGGAADNLMQVIGGENNGEAVRSAVAEMATLCDRACRVKAE